MATQERTAGHQRSAGYFEIRGMGGYGREKSFLLFKETEPTPVEDVGYQAWKPARSEQTTFSEGAIRVRQIEGFAGIHDTNQTNDLLIIGSGYDDRLIKAVAEDKDKADKAQIFGLPSLRADMYQENVMRARKASDAVGENKIFDVGSFYAPANDPFVTAETLSEIVHRCQRQVAITNLYLSPLATKPQALGFALYYLSERGGSATSILFPTSSRYAKETSVGLQRVWQYTVEL